MKARLGIAPIAWSNDDLPELGGETTDAVVVGTPAAPWKPP